MQSTELSRPRSKRARLALAAALVAVGCSGSTGGGCASSCGGVFKTVDSSGNPIHYTGTRLANVAQVRLTRSGFTFLNANHLNDILGALNSGTAGGFTIPCTPAPNPLVNACVGTTGFYFTAIVGDENFNDVCDPGEGAKLNMTFKDVSWALDPTRNTLKAHLVTHLKTGDLYVHTLEDHSIICNGYPGLFHVFIDDELAGLPQKDTAIDLDINFSTAPDGRLEIDIPDSSLQTILTNFQPGAIVFDGFSGTNPPAPTGNVGVYHGDGCDTSPTGNYLPSDGTNLNGGCASFASLLNADCNAQSGNNQGFCYIVQYVRDYLLDYVKNTFKTQITGIIRKQLDNVRCQRSHDNSNAAIAAACDSGHPCPNDDDGTALVCDSTRGVCKPASDSSTDPYDCEPIALGVSGQLDAGGLTGKIGFPPGTRLNVFAGLGSKGANAGAQVDANGVQIAAEAGTQPASSALSLCVPPALTPPDPTVPPMNFDDATNKPATVTNYDVGFSLASAMLNRGFLDAYSAGMLCVAVTNQTTAFISSGLFKTFLPSLGLVTGQKDVPMKILLRPTLPPYVRVGKNTTRLDANGNQIPDDPLLTLSFQKMNLDFYALVDERQVRIFTLQADLQLPLDLRTFADPNADTLQPVLGGLDTVLTHISALSPDGGAYSATTDMLAEDPGVVKDLLGAAVRLAQPLLAGVIKPIALPSMLGLKFAVRGIAGAVPMQDTASDGYNHLAVWAQVGECGGTTGVACEQYTVKTRARVARRSMPESLREVKAGARPELELELSALSARSHPQTQYSYRVDGSMWSPWLGSSKLTVRDPLFLVQGHHTVEVTAREDFDDHTMDPNPVAVDFFVSYEAPAVSLAQRTDGAVFTRAHSGATPVGKLAFSYRIDGTQSWTEPGAARVFTQQELSGRGLSVSVSDEAGRAAMAHFGDDESPELARASVGGCATSAHQTAWSLLPLLALVFLRRQRKGSSSPG